jgi:uncharacterized low-complexity protein
MLRCIKKNTLLFALNHFSGRFTFCVFTYNKETYTMSKMNRAPLATTLSIAALSVLAATQLHAASSDAGWNIAQATATETTAAAPAADAAKPASAPAADAAKPAAAPEADAAKPTEVKKKTTEGKCKTGKCGEGKKKPEAKKKAAEGKCKTGKCGEGKKKPADPAPATK